MLSVKNATVTFETKSQVHTAVNDASFEIHAGERFALVGPSGSGKSTLLRAIAGLQKLTRGTIVDHNEIVDAEGVFVPPEKRSIGLMFQQYALFPHLNVSQNIAFGLVEKKSVASVERVKALLSLVELEHKSNAHIATLSGGEQQRVALARALCPRPHVLLLDEPFANLDAGLRHRVREDVQKILETEKQSALLVTHDQSEAMAFASRLAVLDAGEVLEVGTPRALYETPRLRKTASILGDASFLKVNESETLLGQCEGSWAMLRPEDVYVSDEGVAAKVTHFRYQGAESYCRLRFENDEEILARFSGHSEYLPGQILRVCAHRLWGVS